MEVSDFMEKHFKHFNARETLDAAIGWKDLLEGGGKMLLAMGGAMSTAELGISLAEMIRQDKIHCICTTGANLEEEVFNLFCNSEYELVPNYKDLSPEDERVLRDKGFNRVTDTCIPETAMFYVGEMMVKMWYEAIEKGESYFPYEYIYRLLDDSELQERFDIDLENSWVYAAKEKGLMILTPGWEDSTLANRYCAEVLKKTLNDHGAIRRGTEQMQVFAEWYQTNAPIGFFQIGGGIAGDFPICVVPMLLQDVKKKDTPFWAYFAQISDSVTSYGSYSGAVPNEKITWFKLDVDTPKYMINSDASIVAPLIFSYVLGE